jgi:hypothetical protein
MRYNIYRSCTCWILLVKAEYRYRLVTGQWHRLVTTCWYRLVHVYNGISYSDNVEVVSSFDTYILGWQARERIGGFSHLPVVAEEHRGL